MSETREATVCDLMAQIRHGLSSLTLRRLRQGATIADLAAKVDMTPEHWWGVLKGTDELTERELAEMAHALDAEIAISLDAWP